MRTQYGNGFESCMIHTQQTIPILALTSNSLLNKHWHLQHFIQINQSNQVAQPRNFFHFFFRFVFKSNLFYYSRDRFFYCNLSVPRIWTKQFVRFYFFFFYLFQFKLLSVSAQHRCIDSIRSLHRFVSFLFVSSWLFNKMKSKSKIKWKK